MLTASKIRTFLIIVMGVLSCSGDLRTVDLCNQDTGIISANNVRGSMRRTWQLLATSQNCSNVGNTALVLRLVDVMKDNPDECNTSISIPASSGFENLCNFKSGSCFVFVQGNDVCSSAVEELWGCTSFSLTNKNATLPFNITFYKRDTAPTFKFHLNYSFMSCADTACATCGDLVAKVILGVALGIVTTALFIVLLRMYGSNFKHIAAAKPQATNTCANEYDHDDRTYCVINEPSSSQQETQRQKGDDGQPTMKTNRLYDMS